MPETTPVYDKPAPSQPYSSSTVQEIHPVEDLVDYATQYARQKPEVVALWCLGIGFVLGWKLKPW